MDSRPNRSKYAMFDCDNSQAYVDEKRVGFAVNSMLPDEIIPGLYLGGTFSRHPTALQKLNIKNIVTANEEKCMQDPKYRNLCLGWRDEPNQPIFPGVIQAYNFIDDALMRGENVVVHCMAGMSRSPTIVIYYLMKKFNMSFDQANNFVRIRRPLVFINPGFETQLRNLV